MTRSEAIKAFFFKSVLPVIVALILYCIFKSACIKNGELDYVWLYTLRAAVWTPSDVPLDRAGRRFPGWRNRPVRVELHYRRRNRWFRSGVAADRGSVVCAADGVPADRWMIFSRHGNMENCRSCRWKSHSQPDGKR